MKKKWTLKEAIEERILFVGDSVKIHRLYFPCKPHCILEKYFVIITDYFFEEYLREDKPLRHDVDGYYICLTGRSDSVMMMRNEEIEKVPEEMYKLLECELFNFKVKYQKGSEKFRYGEPRNEYSPEWREYHKTYTYKVYLDPNVIVSFEGESETAYLELPPRNAYTC